MRHATPLLTGLVLGLLVAPAARADIDLGIRGGVVSDDTDPFVGVELLFRVPNSEWYVNPNLESVFLDGPNLYLLSLDVHYDLVHGRSYTAWVGAGPTLLHRNRRRGDDNDLGLNILVGAGLNPHGIVRPYLQGKLILADDSEGSIAVGIRF